MKKRLLSFLLALVFSLGLAVPALAAAPTFTDVPAGFWAHEAIEDMAQRQVVNGVGGGKFSPYGKVTNAQFAAMTARLLFPEELKGHTDQTYWWQPCADTLLEAGVLDGTAARAFYERLENHWDAAVMERPMNRYDMAQVMYNALEARSCGLPSESELAQALAEIADAAEIPRNYLSAVSAMYALGCLKGVDQAGNFRGGQEMDRAQACAVLFRLLNTLDNPAPGREEPTVPPEPSLTPAPTPSPTPTPTPSAGPDADLAAARQEMLALINAERAQEGLSPLRLSDQLCQAAQLRAQELVQRLTPDHKRPDGRECFTVLDDMGIRYRAAGENIAAGQSSVEAVTNDWFNSPGHRQNLMNPSFGQIGIGLYYDASSSYRYHWTQVFTN